MRTYHKVHFSPTGTTKSVVNKVADSVSDDFILHDLTSSERDAFELSLSAEDFLVVGVPVYAGYSPQLITVSRNLLTHQKRGLNDEYEKTHN
ncbi:MULTISPECIES: hypothetical protein [unclassified Fusibacter]|uniref:hypothetical protein n=1 Tax=unclassified Fusibacter TaxID=2624464 RepID=UPI0010139EA4|nr:MULTISPECIES: hypothetical protein [unclassified Fusibacter]MCK8060270.1 flavodoxin domain-containing protein [Fusibacter sp. A2]NPE20441.1 hypothetical protein [Fusibacter sp. A1]RXV63646.1 hypothetical protein DWB64_01325 [Fusibacter sp. A1]